MKGPALAWDPLRAVAPPGGCTCAGRCRGSRSSGPSRTCSRSTSRSRPAIPACCGESRPRGGRIAWGVLAPHRAGVQFSLPDADGAKSLLTRPAAPVACRSRASWRSPARCDPSGTARSVPRTTARMPAKSGEIPALSRNGNGPHGLSPVDCSRARWNVLGEKDSRRPRRPPPTDPSGGPDCRPHTRSAHAPSCSTRPRPRRRWRPSASSADARRPRSTCSRCATAGPTSSTAR